MSQLKTVQEDDPNLEMTPMIDVTFLLLIFFMCTLKFKTLEGKLAAYLPKDVGVNQTEAEPVEKVEILLHVVQEGGKFHPSPKGGPDLARPWDGNGRFVFDEKRVVQYSVGTGTWTSVEDLGNRLDKLYRDDPERPATIDARPGTVYGDVVKVLDEALDAGYTDITFVGAYPEPAG